MGIFKKIFSASDEIDNKKKYSTEFSELPEHLKFLEEKIDDEGKDLFALLDEAKQCFNNGDLKKTIMIYNKIMDVDHIYTSYKIICQHNRLDAIVKLFKINWEKYLIPDFDQSIAMKQILISFEEIIGLFYSYDDALVYQVEIDQITQKQFDNCKDIFLNALNNYYRIGFASGTFYNVDTDRMESCKYKPVHKWKIEKGGSRELIVNGDNSDKYYFPK